MANPEDKIIVIVDESNPTIQATVSQLGSKGAQTVELVDGSGNQITDFGQVEATSYNGGPVTVGTTPVELTFTGTTQVISIIADHDNTGKIWIGGATIDNTGANATGRLAPGQAVEIAMNDSSAPLYVVSDTASQTVYKMALT